MRHLLSKPLMLALAALSGMTSLPAEPKSACCTACKCTVMGPTHAPCGCPGTCTCGPHQVPGPLVNAHPLIRLMGSMMDEMDRVPWIGSPQRHFLTQMIPHHRCALAMAKRQMAMGGNPGMIQLAKAIAAEQEYEILLMETLLKQLEDGSKPMAPKPVDAAYRKAMTQTMDDMMSAIPVDSGLLADADRAFAAVMLPHHQAAIAMAAVVLDHQPVPAVRTLAEKIIANQDVEIRQMNEFLQAKPNVTP